MKPSRWARVVWVGVLAGAAGCTPCLTRRDLTTIKVQFNEPLRHELRLTNATGRDFTVMPPDASAPRLVVPPGGSEVVEFDVIPLIRLQETGHGWMEAVRETEYELRPSRGEGGEVTYVRRDGNDLTVQILFPGEARPALFAFGLDDCLMAPPLSHEHSITARPAGIEFVELCPPGP
ncbi:MAG: hypothetical protein HY763_01465 [Planctomycetes bacterium]|nr:hypothetical protein [Planctomycetota bacterium]